MAINVKAGTPAGVHSNIPGSQTKENVKEFDETEKRSHPDDVTELVGRGKSDATIKAGGILDHLKDFPTEQPKPGHPRERIYTDERAENFQRQMEEGFSTGETNQGNPFDIPAAGSTKPRTLSESVQEVVFRFKLFVVACWLPEGYEVVQKAPMIDVRNFLANARELWQSYEPLLGKRVKTDSILQVEAPPEEDEE